MTAPSVSQHSTSTARSRAAQTGRGRSADTPTEIPARGWKDIVLRVKNEIGDDHTTLSAAGIAFFGFLAIIPGLAALVSLAGLVIPADEVTQRSQDLLGSLPTDARQLLTDQLETIAGRGSNTLSISLAISVGLSLWSASSGMGHLIEGVNVAYDEKDERNWFVKKALALVLTLGAVVFVVFAVIGLAALPPIVDALNLPDWAATVVKAAFWPVLVIGFALGLAVIYRRGPHRADPQWKWVSTGSVLAISLWLLASVGFRYYASNFASYDETYGSLAAVVVLMTWLYLTAFVVLLGAQINAEMEHQTARDSTDGPAEPLGQRGAVMADSVGRSSDEPEPGPESAAEAASERGHDVEKAENVESTEVAAKADEADVK
jgi:membrane protein